MNGFSITGNKQQGGGMMMSMLRRLFWGLSAAVLTYVVVPKMRHMARPVVDKGVGEVKNLAQRGKMTIEEYKARQNKQTNIAQDTSLEQVQVASDVLSSKINALQEMVDKIQNEINLLREKR
ncbi:MAG: hypothetical protein ACOX2A_11045 [Tepidanaerobacteraceae bacterium]